MAANRLGVPPCDFADLVTVMVQNSRTDQAKHDRRDRGTANKEQVRENCPNHRRAQQGSSQCLKARNPKKDRGPNFDCACHITEPLADTNAVEDHDHVRHAGKFGATRCDEGESQECTKYKGKIFHFSDP